MAYDFQINQTSGKVSGLTKTVLYGEDINQTKVPEHTASWAKEPMIVFQSPDGKRFGLNASLLSKHLLLLGGIGSGKTNCFNFIIEDVQNEMTDNDILIIFDTKGDFFRKFYQPGNPNHIVIGNGKQYANISRYWDIFGEVLGEDGRFTEESELVAKEIAKQLFKGKESSTQPFFASAATDLVAKVMIDLGRRKDASKLTTEELVAFIKAANVREYYDMTQRHKDFKNAQLYFGNPDKALTAQALGVFGYINEMVNDLFVGVFGKTKNTQPFSMRKLVREKGKKVVFIEYDLSMGEVLGPIYRILIDLALKEGLGRTSGGQGNVYVMMDEGSLVPNSLHIANALNFGRSLGIKVCMGWQSINQVYDIYGEEKGKALLAGFMNSFCFQTWDYSSRKYISERFGDNYVNLSYRIDNQPVVLQKEGKVVEDYDIQSLGIGEAFVNLVGEVPFRFQFSDYELPH